MFVHAELEQQQAVVVHGVRPGQGHAGALEVRALFAQLRAERLAEHGEREDPGGALAKDVGALASHERLRVARGIGGAVGERPHARARELPEPRVQVRFGV